MQEKITVKNKYNTDLSVIIEIPEDNLKDLIIISHCFTCSKSYKLYNNISKTLVDSGYGVIRYDVMGLGNSGGDFSDTSFSTNVEDLITIYDYLSKNYQKPKYLLGHSIGSLVSIKAASKLDSIKGVATVGSPADFKNLLRLFSYYEEELNKKNNIVVNIAGRKISIGLQYLKDIKSESIENIIRDFKKPIIMFHSNADKTVPYTEGLKLFNEINSEKSFVTLNNVDHLASNKKDSSYISSILYSWLENLNKE